MAREIDIVIAKDISKLKMVLQGKADNGWEIKGVIGYNPHNSQSEPVIILERVSTEEATVDDSVCQCEEMQQIENYTRPEPKYESASISVGND